MLVMARLIVFLAAVAFLMWLSPSTAAAQTVTERKAINLAPVVYDAYVGKYELSPEFVITVVREVNGLSIQATDQPKFEIFAESESKFFLKAVDAQITFVKNEKGEVTHLVLHQNGANQSARRIASQTAAPARQASASSPAAARPPLALPVEMMVPFAPSAFKGDGKTHFVYELHLTNFGVAEMAIAGLEITDADGRTLAKYEGEELAARLARPGVPQGSDKLRLGGGLRAVAYLWLTFDPPTAVPGVLRHNLSVRINPAAADGGVEMKGFGAELNTKIGAPIVISSPLRGDGWLAANGPSNTSGHRRALIPVGGAAHIAQRFAIDWVQLREHGKTWSGDQLKNESYRCYGAEAMAVGDGVVAGVKDGIPENIPGANSRAVPITLETVGGNFVILDLGQGRYAFYAHLQPGSLRVKAGDKVKRGQVVGLVGNSGNSTEPHLHFHIGSKNAPLASEGLPYVLDSFEVQGKGWGWKPSGQTTPSEWRRMEMPMQDAVVRLAPR